MRKFLAAFLIWLALASPALAAIGTPASLGSTSATSTATSLAITTAANIAAGDLVIVVSSSGGAAPPTGATDSGGVNAYTCVAVSNTVPSLNYCYVANASAVASGGTVTTTGWSSSNVTKASAAFTVSGMDSPTSIVRATQNQGLPGTGVTGTGTSASGATTNGPFFRQPALIVGMLGANASVGTITMAGWNLIVTSAASNQQVSIWYKIVTGYAADATWQPSWVNSKAYRTTAKWFFGASPTYAPFGQATLLGIGQ